MASVQKMSSATVARKVAVLGSTVAILAFSCGYVGTKMLMDQENKSADVENMNEVQSSVCSGDYLKSSESCFSKKRSSYYREFLLWNDFEVKGSDAWPVAINEDEEILHSQRFDDVLPKLEQNALNALQADSIEEVDPVVFEATLKALSDTDETPVSDTDGEGGRRLAEHENPLIEEVHNHQRVSSKTDEVESAELSMITYNSYTKGQPVNDEYPWGYMVEPYRATTLELGNTVEGATYRWTIDGHVHGYGTYVEAMFTDIGYHSARVEEMVVEEDGTTTSRLLVVKLMCKYVRREVRALSNLDRETWFSAVAVMQHVPTMAGQAIYGPKFMSKDVFTRLHLYYGGAMDCDHWHQGAGFVTSHIALTLQWEQALQAVNPSIAAPYWDFTLDSTFYGARDWSTSFIFSDDWFGEASPNNALHTVTKGRFQYVATLLDAKKFSYWVNSYGLLRAPWNNDPTPFLTRSGNIYGLPNNMKPSGCSEYRTSLKQNTWMAMSKKLNSAAHGHIHELMGGAWNHYLMNLVEGDRSPAVYTFAHQIQGLSKILWREGYVECPETCSMTDAAADCQCMCSAESLKGKTSLEILSETGLLSAASFFDAAMHKLDPTNFLDENGDAANPIAGYTIEETKHIHNNLLGLLCNPGHIGDMFQATSTNDITFWLIHLTVDRLWHYKRLGNTQDYDETWDPYHKCYGHNPRNFQPFKDLFHTQKPDSRRLTDVFEGANHEDGKAAPAYHDDSYVPGHYYTNMELYENLHPASGSLQYVYDDFSWQHCAKLGYVFTNA